MSKPVGVSNRGKAMPASPIRKLHPFGVAAKAEGVTVYHLNIGQPDIKTPEQLIRGYREFNDPVLPYGPSQGLAAYQSKLVTYYSRFGIDVTEENIFVTTGGSEAIIFSLMAVTDPGDEVIIPEPFYTNYNGFSTMAGAVVRPLTTTLEENFALPELDSLEALINERTKAIVLCSPGNPTGAVFKRDKLEGVAEIARRYGLYLIADEVYREFVYDGNTHTSILELPDLEEHAIVVDSISKRYSACGARIGCIVSRNINFMDAILRLGQARLCPPTVDQIAAMHAIDTPQSYFDEVLAEYDERRRLLHRRLGAMGVDCKLPGGAFYMVARLPVKSADDFAVWLLREHRHENSTVMIAPAEGFYATPGLGRNEARIAYVLNCDDLSKAMDSFEVALKRYPG